eukprot:4112162-Pleurochrysis_carterae.AAC.1
MDKVFASLEERLVPLAERIVGALEEAGEPRRTVRKPFDEALLLEGVNGPPPAGVLLAQAAAPKRESNPEVQQLQADFDAVLKQRSELRAQLIVANERLESAEAALVRGTLVRVPRPGFVPQKSQFGCSCRRFMAVLITTHPSCPTLRSIHRHEHIPTGTAKKSSSGGAQRRSECARASCGKN